MSKFFVAVLSAAAAAVAFVPAAAAAAPPPAGGLQPLGCTGTPAFAALLECTPGSPALEGMHDLALSPDGRQLYAVGQGADMGGVGTVLTYERDVTTGALTFARCRGVPADGCADDPRVGQAGSIALAPDGSDVLVGNYDKGLVRYRRNAAGQLAFAECFTATAVAGCTQVPGLQSLTDVAISADGASVYVSAYGDDAVGSFSRDTVSGALTWRECATTGGAAGCADVSGAIGDGLHAATGLAVSADGARLYVSARGDAATTFALGAAGALLDPRSLASDEYLDGAQTVVAAPNGFAYVGLFDGAGLTALAVDGAGVPALAGCLMNSATPSCPAAPGVDAVFGLGLAPGGDVLYAGARNGGTVSAFRRQPGGGLSLLTCHGADMPDEGIALEPGCARGPNGLVGAEAVAATADGRFVYATGAYSIVTLAVEQAPVCEGVTRRVPNDRPTELRVSCSDANGQPLAVAAVSQPAGGAVTVVDAASGLLRYSPAGGFDGVTSFRFRASDGTNASADATATLHVFATPPKLTIAAKRLRLTARGRLRVRLRCAAGQTGGCRGKLSARSARKLKLRGGKRRYLKLGARRFSIADGGARTVTLAVPKAARRVVAAKGRLSVRLELDARDAAGNRRVGAKRIVVLAPKRRR